jgi:tetratricopeptide (TPR) repeat protein
MEKEIDTYLAKLLSEEQKDKWIVVVAEIFNRFGPKAIEKIVEAIGKDSLKKPDNLGIVSLLNSEKWNSLGLTYYQNGFFAEAIAMFEALLSREPNNSATQNNYGITLIAVGNFDGAKEFLKEAFETDKKRSLERVVEAFEA